MLAATLPVVGQEMRCITSIKDVSFKNQPLPADIKKHVPHQALVRLVLPLSSTETLTLYELGDRSEPDTRLLITRSGQPVYRFAAKDISVGNGNDPEWGKWAVGMKVAHLCANSEPITYIVLQAGNQGGYFMALKEDGQSYRFLPIADTQQGRLVLHVNTPCRIAVWTVASEDAGDCTGCPKHYLVKTMELEDSKFKITEKKTTKKKYQSFQDEPLLVQP